MKLLIIKSSRQTRGGQLLLGASKTYLGKSLKPVRDAAMAHFLMAIGWEDPSTAFWMHALLTRVELLVAAEVREHQNDQSPELAIFSQQQGQL